MAVCMAMDRPSVNLEATEANCQVIETVADYIEERFAHDAYAIG